MSLPLTVSPLTVTPLTVTPRSLTRAALVAALASGFAAPASAEITPAEVWADWQRLIESYATTLSVGGEATSGGTLTLTDVTLEFEAPDDIGGFAATVPEMVFAPRGDGTVEIRISPEYPLAFNGVDAETETPFSVSMIARQPGLVTIASREGPVTRYDYIGPEIGATIENMQIDGEDFDFDFDLAITGTTGSYVVTEGTPRTFTGTTKSEALSLLASGSDPENPASVFDVDLSVTDLASNGSGTIAGVAAFTDLATLLGEGFATEWRVTHGPADYSISGVDDDDRFNLSTTAAAGDFTGSISPEGLVYGGGNTGLDIALTSSEIPFPQVSFSMAETEARLALPVAPSEEASDFGLVLRLVDLEVSEVIWGMFDPAGQLPRDPATLALDLAGTGRWLVDVFNEETANSLDADDVPGEIETLDINSLNLSLAGAELTGEGGFEFDNTANGAFAPGPSPYGSIELSLDGGNQLLDTLVAMGLLPQEQAMGARMMLGLFARPGTGTDNLISTIEVGRDGSVSANGQRIR